MLVKGYTLCLRLTSFQRADIRPLEAAGGWIHPTQQQAAKPHFQSSTRQRLQSHRPSCQTRPDEQFLSVISDRSMVAYFARRHAWIVQIFRTTLIGPTRWFIHFRRTFHCQCFMRPLLIKLLSPHIQSFLLRRGGFEFHTNVPMHPLVPAVVLRMPGPSTLQIDAQCHPPRRQPAQSHHPLHMRKGYSVVTSNGSRQTVLLKQPLKTGLNCLGARVGHPPQFQYIPAMFVPHRQRFTAFALPVIPPAFEIHCPDIIGTLSSTPTPQPPRLTGTLSATTRFGQPHSRQHSLETALRSRFSMLSQIQFSYLPRSPIPMRLLEAYDLADLCFAQLLGMSVWSARLLSHPSHPIPQKSLPPLIPRLGADPILPAQLPKVVRPHRSHRKLHPLIHRFFLFPRHPEAYRLPCLVLSVTYVLSHHRYPCSEPAPEKLFSAYVSI